jgi:hypothetical protein
MLLRPAESFALIYPPDSPRWSGVWNQEIAFAWARYAFLDWQIHAFEDGPKREELERRIIWFRDRYPEAGEIEVLEGRKLLALPGGPDYRRAHAAFKEAIRKGTTDPAAWANRGWCRRHLPGIDEHGVFEEILADFREALRLTLERRKGDPHDVSFSTPLTNYRSTIVMALATAAERGQDERSETLGLQALEVFAQATVELLEAAHDPQLPTRIVVALYWDAINALDQWKLILQDRGRPESEFSEPNRLAARVQDEVRRLVLPHVSVHEAAAVDARLCLLELAPSAPHNEEPGRAKARRDARCRAIASYRELIKDFKGQDRSKEVDYSTEVETLKAQQRWERARAKRGPTRAESSRGPAIESPSTTGLDR